MPPQRKEGCRAYSFEREDKGVYNKVNDCSPNHEKRAQDAPFFSVWRRRWDSNPRYPEVQLISSQSRYDHFDTSPFNNYLVFGANNMISSQSRYDHFDTSPFLFFYSYLFSFFYSSALSLLPFFHLCSFLLCFAKNSFKIS